MSVCLHLDMPHACSTQGGQKRAEDSLGTGVRDGCELSSGCWELNLEPLSMQQALLATHSSPLPPILFIYFLFIIYFCCCRYWTFLRQGLLCSSSWLQTYDPPASASKVWGYWSVPLCLSTIIPS